MAMIEPRQNFQQGPYAKSWLDLADSAQFQSAAQAALAQMQINLSGAADMGSAAAFHFRMEGAKQFLQVLMSLTEPPKQANKPPGVNLNHRT